MFRIFKNLIKFSLLKQSEVLNFLRIQPNFNYNLCDIILLKKTILKQEHFHLTITEPIRLDNVLYENHGKDIKRYKIHHNKNKIRIYPSS